MIKLSHRSDNQHRTIKLLNAKVVRAKLLVFETLNDLCLRSWMLIKRCILETCAAISRFKRNDKLVKIARFWWSKFQVNVCFIQCYRFGLSWLHWWNDNFHDFGSTFNVFNTPLVDRHSILLARSNHGKGFRFRLRTF